MDFSRADKLVRTLLYEGSLLYPYRPSALKNRHPWTFGVLFPQDFCLNIDASEKSSIQTEGLVLGQALSRIQVQIRFLQLKDGKPVERAMASPPLGLGHLQYQPFQIFWTPDTGNLTGCESGNSKVPHGVQDLLESCLEISTQALSEELFKITVRVKNQTVLKEEVSTRDAALHWAMISVHILVAVEKGRFVSLQDPGKWKQAAAMCRNQEVWPVLIGDQENPDLLLSSPIILPDYPRIAPESPGDFYDGTEVDELLTLRIQTLADQEKKEIRASENQAGSLLQRTENLTGESIMALHGAIRKSRIFKAGDRVRLRPRGRADAFDLLLNGMIATVASIEQDFENRLFLTVTLDADPGKDLGDLGQPGHRFFFRPEEVELVQGE